MRSERIERLIVGCFACMAGLVADSKKLFAHRCGADVDALRLRAVDDMQVLAVRGRRPRRTGPVEHERFQACLGSNVPQLFGAATARVEAIA